MTALYFSRLYSYHDLCEALGREPSASLRQTLYRARSGDKANGARPWLVEGVHYIRRWRGIAYTEEGVVIVSERISRKKENFT